MDLKKSHKANLERKQSGRFFLGLTITLSLILIGFEWTTLSTKLAEVYAAPHPKFLAGMAKMKSFLEEWSRSVQPLENIIKRIVTARIIKITPHKMIYMNLPEGIPYMRWEKDA